MASVNKVILVGNLGRDPESRSTPDGFMVANVSIATTSSWKDKVSGERREDTEWHRVVFYNRLAEIVTQYLKKGSAVYIEGRLKTRKWQDQQGQDRYTTEIVADNMQMLGGRGGEASFDGEPSAPGRHQSNDGGFDNSQARAISPNKPRPLSPAVSSSSMDGIEDDIPF